MLEQKAETVAETGAKAVAKSSRSSDELRTSLQQQATMLGQQPQQDARAKKIAVSAEPATQQAEIHLVHHPKDPG